MSIIETIIKANKEGRKVEWPSAPKLSECIKCYMKHPKNEMMYNYCIECWENLSEEDQFDEINTQACIAAGR